MPGLRSAPDAVHTLRLGRGRARLGPWSADLGIARLVASPDAPLDVADVHSSVDHARALGYRGLVTNALSDAEAAPFLACDFAARERLHLLAADLDAAPTPPAVPVTRVRRREHDDVISLDTAAFPRDWQLGRVGLADALGATPSRQFRATRDGDVITGYAITGLAGHLGYLQRIAADPARRRAGIGRALVADAFTYLWSRGVSRVYVNTQLDNVAALALYESCGFELSTSGLTVLEYSW
ncbi:MAG: GNAT family N-acetyltransferase [Acidimicrobiia bacterium]